MCEYVLGVVFGGCFFFFFFFFLIGGLQHVFGLTIGFLWHSLGVHVVESWPCGAFNFR